MLLQYSYKLVIKCFQTSSGVLLFSFLTKPEYAHIKVIMSVLMISSCYQCYHIKTDSVIAHA